MLGGTPGVSDRRRPLLPVHGKDGMWPVRTEVLTSLEIAYWARVSLLTAHASAN